MLDTIDLAQIGMESGRFWAALATLALFGIAYNWLIGYLHRNGYNDGFVWLEVVGGVAATLLIAAIVTGIHTAILYLLFFAISGAPMAIGDIIRYVRARSLEKDE